MLPQLAGRVEALLHFGAERIVAFQHDAEQVAHRHDFAQVQRIALVYQQLDHDLERRALALQRRGDAHQRFHQRGRKRVDLPELLQVALLRQQDLLDGFLDLLNGLERLPDQFGRRAVLRHQ